MDLVEQTVFASTSSITTSCKIYISITSNFKLLQKNIVKGGRRRESESKQGVKGNALRVIIKPSIDWLIDDRSVID